MGYEPGWLTIPLVGETEFFGSILIAISFLSRSVILVATILLFIATMGMHLANDIYWAKKATNTRSSGQFYALRSRPAAARCRATAQLAKNSAASQS